MAVQRFLKGEIVHDIENGSWAQFIEEKEGIATLFNRLGDDREVEIDDLVKAELPLALDALGFRLYVNEKKDTEKYRHNGNTIDIIGSKYFIRGREVINTVDVQLAFDQFKLIPFSLLERRMSNH
ncbi:hypothetical protein [Mucilaginibacter sp.]|uniref:hypothetical protein n=1 Tax=Mucilaginibacter sp. TaxID=1882438 RepID=UPI0026071009|nr:hypothetical protein [Mucilaginibacter sp.]MDB4925528.1 hypothetical protein [Mucilaginibacter sp.]